MSEENDGVVTGTEEQAVKPAPPQEKVFGDVPPEPTQAGPEGIRFDFCDGLRLRLPERGEYHVVFRDADRGVVLYDAMVPGGAMIASVKKFFLRFSFEVYRGRADIPLFTHDFDCLDKEVLVQLPSGTLGDSIAWFSYVERFQRRHGCRLVCSMSPEVADILRGQYDDIEFISRDDTARRHPYACYNLGLYFGGDTDHQPYDFRFVGLHRTAGAILGLDDLSDCPPRFDLSAPRMIAEQYAVIAAKASSQCKMWNNPSGWREVVSHLQKRGLRVLCIDREREYGSGLVWNGMPYGAEDFTGNLPLQERIDLIKNAEVFVGLSSGLSWLAWGCGVPVVMVSGFTEPENEFGTPYRVINPTVCHGCWNDTKCEFDHFDFLWCPRHKGTDRQFECTRHITAKMVNDCVDKALRQRSEKEES